MNCAGWSERIPAYVDGELDSSQQEAFRAHAQECSRCASQALTLVENKAAIRRAGNRYSAPGGLRERVLATATEQSSRKDSTRDTGMLLGPRPGLTALLSRPVWGFAAAALLLAAVGLFLLAGRNSQSKSLAEFADLHVTTLASSNPVDVVSTDRHTVKPWFQGKLPFSFDLPELRGTPFTLVGGRMTFFHQEPGAQLIFAYQLHRISVFVFRDTAELGLPRSTTDDRRSSFTTSTWSRDGLRYVVVGDAGASTIRELAEILQQK